MSEPIVYTQRGYAGPIISEEVTTTYDEILKDFDDPCLVRSLVERCLALERELAEAREALLKARTAYASELANSGEAESALAAERIENARLREAFVTMEKAYNTAEAEAARLRAYVLKASVAATEREEALTELSRVRQRHAEADTCVVCKATLLPPTEPPHCEDCHPTEDDEAAWLASGAKARLT
jgi:hypothetical protein